MKRIIIVAALLTVASTSYAAEPRMSDVEGLRNYVQVSINNRIGINNAELSCVNSAKGRHEIEKCREQYQRDIEREQRREKREGERREREGHWR